VTGVEVEPAMLTDPDTHARGASWQIWRWMRQHAPVYWHPAGAYPGFWSVTGHADVRRVYLDDATFTSTRGVMLRPLELGDDPAGGLTLALVDPPRHGEIRALIGDLFTGRSARELDHLIRRQVRDRLDAFLADGGDFIGQVAVQLTVGLTSAVIGVPAADHDQLLRWTSEAFEHGRSLATHQEFMGFLLELIDVCAEEPGDDVISRLTTGTVGGNRLSTAEILLNCENIIGATENAGLSMGSAVVAFAEHPDQWALLARRRALLPTAVNEILRWSANAAHSMRVATGPAVLRGQAIAAGDRVVLWLPSANRDEDVFDRADEFLAARRPNRHLSLGAGPHACIGAALARAQLSALLSELLDRGMWVEPTGPVVPLRSIVVRGPASLPARVRRWRRDHHRPHLSCQPPTTTTSMETCAVTDIDADLVRALVSDQFPDWTDLTVASVEPQGWDNRTFRLGTELSVRLPSAQGYVAAIEKEDRWLPVLGANLPLPVPSAVASGRPGRGYPFPWSVRRWLPGIPVSVVPDIDRLQLARDLGVFLSALRAVPTGDGPAGGRHNYFRGAHPSIYSEQVQTALRALGDRVDAAACRAIWAEALRSAWPSPQVWIHGDVAPDNLLAEDGRLSAVIDFGTCGIGDPACDLVMAWTYFSGAERKTIREATGLDDDTWRRARGWALWKALATMAGLSSPDPDRFQDTVLIHVLADAVID
jgi:cytochrome P450/aminoglycoside phosphotransferase (APT) family kinase protein